MLKYVVVSQGIKIAEFFNKEVAEAIVKKENEKFYKYRQKCLDSGEIYADNELFLYEEEYEPNIDSDSFYGSDCDVPF